MNKKLRKQYFKDNQPSSERSRNFWNYCKPYFTDRNIIHDERIRLIEKGHEIRDDFTIANVFNDYFINCTKLLDIPKWKPIPNTKPESKFDVHPSIINILEREFGKSFNFEIVNKQLLQTFKKIRCQ